MAKEYSDSKKRGDQILIKAFIPNSMFEELQKYAPPYEKKWQSMVLRKVIFEWLEVQKNKKV